MFCDQCGKPLSMDSKFCPSCGKPVAFSQISPAQPQNSLMQQPVPPQQVLQNVENSVVNESGFEMTTGAMVVGIIFFILTLILGLGCACMDLLYFEEWKSALGSKLYVLFFIEGGLIIAPIKGFVDIGKGKSYKSEAITVGVCSIGGIVVGFHYGEGIFDAIDYILTGIFALVLFIVALCHEK